MTALFIVQQLMCNNQFCRSHIYDINGALLKDVATLQRFDEVEDVLVQGVEAGVVVCLNVSWL